MVYMEKSGLIRQLHTAGNGMAVIEKTEKVYLGNTNFIYALSDGTPNKKTAVIIPHIRLFPDRIFSRPEFFVLLPRTRANFNKFEWII